MDIRALTKDGVVIAKEDQGPAVSPFLIGVVVGALLTIPLHAIILWSLS